ncbi:MAG: sulfatase-like hydrolase/transferase [Proteobacteria bacterium]|nr:sulfatase-like hydrolase/transferase [Pseudomonadota bacterium]
MSDQSINRRGLLSAVGLSLLAGAGGLSATKALGQPAPASAGARPNLILFFPDEMRADALACYGNPVTKTPNFDRLAREGARFENCHVQYPVCGASRCSLLTGWPTSVHGHRSLYYFLRPDEPNMFRYLKEAGYDVFWFGKNDALAQQSFEGSVTEWRDVGAGGGPLGGARQAQGDPAPFTMLFPGGGDRRQTGDYRLLQMAIRVLERKEADRPFCIFLPLSEPHPPYAAPADFDKMYSPSDLPPLVPPDLPKHPAFMHAMRERYGLTRVSDGELRQVRATYYGQVSYSDWLLGELLEALERTGHAKDTALITSSDHGDYAGDYGLVEKWPAGLESCLTHVPLIARIPGGTPGVVRPEMNELYDIMPTFLELAGTKATHTHFARSLLPQLHGAPGDPHRCAFSEGGYNVYEPQAFEPQLGGLYGPKTDLQNDQPETVSRCASVKTPRYTYVARPGGQSELYDRQTDAAETKNLIDDKAHAGVRQELQLRLVNWYIDTTGVPASDKDPRSLPPYYKTPPKTLGNAERARILDR